MPFAVPRALPLSLLAAFVLAGCAEKGAAPLKEGEKPLDVASVCAAKNARQREGSQCVGGCISQNL
ncbi:hypothetical protein ABFY58_25005 [Enterobacter soli]